MTILKERHGVEMGPGPQDPGPRTRDSPQILKMGPGNPLKCKGGTAGPLQNLKVGPS